MYGGHGCGKFYIREVARIEKFQQENLPPGGYSPEQIQAGYKKLAEVFGFSHTLFFLEKETGQPDKEIQDWTVTHFKFRLRYIAWRNYTEDNYNKILKDKK